MTNITQSLPCPVCQESIPFNTDQLLLGQQFCCPNPACDATIGLASESKDAVRQTMEKFNDVKKKIGQA
jgi:hypothetical protein